jgi:hypothetical protein
MYSLFVRLISHQPAVLFSQNKSAPAISHQPNEQAGNPFDSTCSFFLKQISNILLGGQRGGDRN